VKVNKGEIFTELEEAMAKLTVVHADRSEFFTSQQKSYFLVSVKDFLERGAGMAQW